MSRVQDLAEHGVLLHRGLMCTDETGTEAELLEHVLWYYPASDDNRRRLQRLSVAESLMAFSLSFAGSRVDSVLMRSSRYVFLEVEPEVWMVWVTSASCEAVTTQSLMLQTYDTWALFHGTVASVVASGRDAIKRLAAARVAARKAARRGEASPDVEVDSPLEALRASWTAHMRIPWAISPLADLVGFEHCGAEPVVFATAHRAQRDLSNCLPVAASTIFYRGSILWNGLGIADTLALYQVAVDKAGDARPGSFVYSPGGAVFWTVYLGANAATPPVDVTWYRATRVGPDLDPEPAPYLLYALSADLAVLVAFDPTVSDHTLRRIDLADVETRLDASLGPLASALGMRSPRLRGSPVDGCDFVYFNRASLSLKFGFHDALPAPVLKAVDDALAFFLRPDADDDIMELATQLAPDASVGSSGWLVAKKNAKRLIFLVLDARFADFRDACDAVDGLKAGLLANVFVP